MGGTGGCMGGAGGTTRGGCSAGSTGSTPSAIFTYNMLFVVNEIFSYPNYIFN